MIKKHERLLVGLEIGATKVSVLVGKILSNGIINIIGIGNYTSKGINKGNIHDLNAIIDCVKKAIYQAEIIAECHISSVYLAISDQYISYKNEIGIVPISLNKITKKDIKYAIYTAKAIKLDPLYNILHTIPQEYSIDNNIGIENPIGLSGIRMQAKVHLITYQNKIKKKFIKILKKCNLQIEKIIFSGLASSEAVLTKEEKKSGVCMIDIGGGNIDFIIYIDGKIQHSQVIPYAGNTITNDIAYIFNISFKNAENIKIKYGSTKISSLLISKLIEVSNINENDIKKIKQNTLIEVIKSRYSELLNIVNQNIIKIQKKLYYLRQPYLIGSGIVITGGSSKITYLKSFAEKIFNMSVRIGIPINIQTYNKNILNPNYSTTIGLLKYGKYFYQNNKNTKYKKNFLKKWFTLITKWIKNINN